MNENLQQVGYVGLRNQDGSYMFGIPVYIKVNDLNKNGVTDQQEELIHRVSEIILNRYEKQLSDFIANKKGGQKNEIQG